MNIAEDDFRFQQEYEAFTYLDGVQKSGYLNGMIRLSFA